MGQAACQVMSEYNFWNGTKSKKAKILQEARALGLLYGRCQCTEARLAVHLGLFLKLVEMDPFRQAISISSICYKVFRTVSET